MIQDDQVIEDMARADQIKAAAPPSGVSVDAIFLALRGVGGGARKRAWSTDQPSGPPDWFHETLAALKGKPVSIAGFMLFAGRASASKRERNLVGKWLRQTGRQPRKSHGDQVFDL